MFLISLYIKKRCGGYLLESHFWFSVLMEKYWKLPCISISQLHQVPHSKHHKIWENLRLFHLKLALMGFNKSIQWATPWTPLCLEEGSGDTRGGGGVYILHGLVNVMCSDVLATLYISPCHGGRSTFFSMGSMGWEIYLLNSHEGVVYNMLHILD